MILIKYSHFKLLVCLILLVSTGVFANNSDQWLTHEINVEDGLPDSTVFSIQQDHSGFMWFGTTNGLARYDGYSFKVFTHDGADKSTISNNNAGNVFIDSKNILWIGTFGGGVNTLDLNSGELTRYPYSNSKLNNMVSENVQTFYEDRNSNIWIGTAAGLYKFNGQVLAHYNHQPSNPNSLINSRVWNITADKKGDLWIGTSEGLSHLNPSTGQIKNYKLPENLTVDISSNQFRKIFLNDKTLWIGSSTGLYSFDLDSKIFKSHTVMHNMKINDIKLISKDLIVIASMDGLFQFDLSKNLFRKNDSGMYWHALKHVDVRNLFFDKSGLLWLSTRDKGVIKVDQYGGLFQPQNNYIPENQQNEQNKQIWSLEHDSEGNLYMGTSETLFKKFKDKGFKRITIKNLNEIPGIIRDTQSSKNQGTWIGTSEGLFFLEKDSLVAQSITKPFDLLGIKPTDVFSVEETSNGEVWLALYNVGVLRWQPDLDKATLLTTYSDGLLTDINIVHIYQDSMNDIWIGSNLVGVFRFDIKTEEIQLFSHDYNNKKSLSSNRIKDIFEDSKGRLWLATFRGLNLFNPKDNTFRHFMVSDGLLDNSINAIVEDSNQILWIIYKFGISRFIPEDSLITNYLLNNDILLDGLNARSASFDKDNKLLVGGTNGFYSFDPKDIGQTKSYLPTLTLTDVRINNKTLSFDELLHNGLNFVLKPKDRVISFNFAALDFKISHQIQYKYKIHEIYDDWRDVTSNRQIELNNINPGTYLIEIKALNNDGRWAEQSLKLNLEVQPVWWNLGWVRILLVLIGVILASCINYYRTYKIKKQNELLEAKVEKRTAELVSLNKQLKKASQTDFLTGLYNRSGFIKRFKQKQKKSNEYCVVVSDIDNFKMINDIHSHSAGDTILVKVTEIMRSLMPDRDLIARWGGEEFIFYFGNKDSEQASKIIEQIRLKIENTEIRYKDKLIRVTCTFGICQRKAEMGLKDCINAADECMYQGKKKGKNMTVVSKANLSNLK